VSSVELPNIFPQLFSVRQRVSSVLRGRRLAVRMGSSNKDRLFWHGHFIPSCGLFYLFSSVFGKEREGERKKDGETIAKAFFSSCDLELTLSLLDLLNSHLSGWNAPSGKWKKGSVNFPTTRDRSGGRSVGNGWGLH